MNNKFYQVSVVFAENGRIRFDVEPAAEVNGYFAAGLVHELTWDILGIKLPWNVPGYWEFLVWAPSAWAAADRVVSWLLIK